MPGECQYNQFLAITAQAPFGYCLLATLCLVQTNVIMGDTSLPRALQESLDDTKVSYVRLGASGLKVSIPILGTMSFGKPHLHPISILQSKAGIREVYKKTVLDALPVLSHLHPSQGLSIHLKTNMVANGSISSVGFRSQRMATLGYRRHRRS